MGTLHEGQCTFSIISPYNEKCFTKTLYRRSKHTFYVQYFFFENPAVYETRWKNILEPSRAQVIIWRMRISCWTPKATNTISE